MNREFAIRAEDLGKRYRIGVRSERYKTLRDALAAAAASPIRRLRRAAGGGLADGENSVWALRDVSFEIRRGEVVGVIGRNGAGKSTLLKILSRITEPTTGYADIAGRVGSLLEVGTGFHPELTGRENIYLNGAILGMRRAEIDRRFDEIVAFAEVEQFIDTAVKHYSSGMYLRLAFAVAAHLEPEILLVDEVLAVGDLGFQKKCLGKMSEVADHGRTVFFVSHNMQAISSLTTRCLILQGGSIQYDGPTDQALRSFVESMTGRSGLGTSYENRADPDSNHVASARAITSSPLGQHDWGRPITFEFALHIGRPKDSLCFSFQVVDNLDRPVCHFWLTDRDLPFRSRRGDFQVRCEVPMFRLYMGTYTLSTWIGDRRGQDLVENVNQVCPFEVGMGDNRRDEYDWSPGACVYLEDARWTPAVALDGARAGA